jgi:hypothetical protein
VDDFGGGAYAGSEVGCAYEGRIVGGFLLSRRACICLICMISMTFVYLGTVEGGCVWRRFCMQKSNTQFSCSRLTFPVSPLHLCVPSS